MNRRSWTAGAALLGVLAAGAVLNRAALHATLDLDDFAQRAMIEGKLTPHRGPLNLYDLIADDNRAALVDRGVIPWWSDPHLVVRFLRPLPSVLVWADHRLFGQESLAPHLLSFFWWAAAVLAAHLLFRTVAQRRASWIATVLFAFSPALAIPLVWLANRCILVTLTFAAPALALYVRWRKDRSRALGLATAGAFGAAALTGEYALGLVSYLIAFELCLRAEPARRRVIGILPAAAPLAVYLVTRAVLGYGTAGTGFYRDPTTDPGTYLQALPRTFSALFASSWLGADVTAPWLGSRFLQSILVLGAGVLAAWTVWSARRERSAATPEAGRWLACGAVISLLPLAATEPSRRLIGVAALGVSGAIGVLLAEATRALRRPFRLSFVVGVALLAGLIHLAVAPFQTRRLSADAVEEQIQNLARFATVPPRVRSVDTAVVVRANYGLTVLSAPFILGEQAPRHWLVLSHTFEQTAAIRTSPSAIDVVQANTPLFPLGPTGIVRTTPFRAGDVVETAALQATVLRVDDAGRPLAVHYELSQNLDGPDVAWISEGRFGFSDVIPPVVGTGVRLAP